MSNYTLWLIAEQFNQSNVDRFKQLVADGRLAHIGYCLPSGRTGDFKTTDQALAWIAEGKNVYADVGFNNNESVLL
jgi:hypothetical protein